MKDDKSVLSNFAAGAVLFLAMIGLTACGNNDVQQPPTEAVRPTSETVRQASLPTTASLPITATKLPTKTPTLPMMTPTSVSAPATPATVAPLPAEAPALSNSETVSSAGVEIYETTLTIPTYPFKDYLVEQLDPVYNIPAFYFRRSDYEAAGPTPLPVDYTGIVLENPYLRLTFLPELGGRLYSAVVKATNQEIFYHNPVVKPSRYGVLQPYEANWWLATGGMEWAYPTQEHGYRFGVAWDYTMTQHEEEAVIILSDGAPGRAGLEVRVTLPADSGLFTVEPVLTNQGPATVPVQLWTNAAMTLGSASMSLDTQFIIPNDLATVHSRGESGWNIPGERQPISWPQVNDLNLSHYRQWANYLGLFTPNHETPFMGAYNPETKLGIARIPETTSGSGKLFAFGKDFPDRSYTDDNSQYFEIWGGANAGFWSEADLPLPAGAALGWREYWWPLPRLGGLTWATEHAAIHLQRVEDLYTLSALVSRPTHAALQVSTEDTTILNEPFSAGPADLMTWNFSAAAPIRIQIVNDAGTILLTYQGN
jgi:hypothetical protein